MEVANKLIEMIKNKKNIDVSENIMIVENGIILKNDDVFDFGSIFVGDLKKSGIYNDDNFMAIGTSEDNNIHISAEYCNIFLNYYAIYYDNMDAFILFPIAC